MSRTKILLATTNQGKIREIKRSFSGLPLQIVGLDDLKIIPDFSEKGKTFAENARGKSIFYSRLSGVLTLAEDSGLEVDALKGAPGIYSARFSGPRATDEKNLQKVLKLLKAVSLQKRKARFVCCQVLSREGRIIKETQGQVRGSITFEKRGSHGFGYDPIFYYPPFKKTFAQVPAEKKNAVSHRGRALRKMKTFLKKFLERKNPRGQTALS